MATIQASANAAHKQFKAAAQHAFTRTHTKTTKKGKLGTAEVVTKCPENGYSTSNTAAQQMQTSASIHSCNSCSSFPQVQKFFLRGQGGTAISGNVYDFFPGRTPPPFALKLYTRPHFVVYFV